MIERAVFTKSGYSVMIEVTPYKYIIDNKLVLLIQ